MFANPWDKHMIKQCALVDPAAPRPRCQRDAGAKSGISVKLRFPNSASLHNIVAFLRTIDPATPDVFELETHAKWVHVHPVVLAMAACAASTVQENEGAFKGE